MAIGERINFFRRRCNMTMNALGQLLGFDAKGADVRIAQYENNSRKPKADLTKAMADVFGVAPEALAVPDIDSYNGLMHTLFTIEDMYNTENSDIPDMNDGDLMKVTADVDIYYGGIGGSNYSIKINKLKSADLMDYNQIIDLLEIDDIADDISIDRMNIIKMHRNEKNGDTYLIFPVTLSSSFELRIYKQGEKSGTGMLYEKYEFDYEKNEGNLHLFLEDIRS